jgi:heme exporter protein CcmD
MTPQFNSLAAFLAMAGHPGYVFGAWGLSALVILWLVVRAILIGRASKARLARARQGLPSE